MISSFERYLKRHNYGISLNNGYEFGKLREVLKCKGRGNKPKAADTINDDEIKTVHLRTIGYFFPSCTHQHSMAEQHSSFWNERWWQ
jgi:hypothetical protein